MDKIRVMIVDDHTILRDGIRALLEDEADMVVVAEAEDGHTAVKLACELRQCLVDGYCMRCSMALKPHQSPGLRVRF
jgi:DNA-binding NarL/FixJ family response regulator